MERYPAHIQHLVSELEAEEDTSNVLKRYIPCIRSDQSLYCVFLVLGYMPECGDFKIKPSREQALELISNEYKNAYVGELEMLSSPKGLSPLAWDLNKGVKDEFLKTYYDNNISEFSAAYDLGLDEIPPLFFEENSLQDMWETKEKKHKPNIKGLKSLSLRVKNIICEQGMISYKELSDQLLEECNLGPNSHKEEKNVLRRVYDALNVLIAAGVVVKVGKKYAWRPDSPEKSPLEEKRAELKDLCKRFYAIKALIHRNRNKGCLGEVLAFPFIVVKSQSEPKVLFK